jgi:hypothetical protein
MGKKNTRAQRSRDTEDWKNNQIDKITRTRRKRRIQRLKAQEAAQIINFDDPEAVASRGSSEAVASRGSSEAVASRDSSEAVASRGSSEAVASRDSSIHSIYEAVAEPSSSNRDYNPSRSVILDWENEDERANAKGPSTAYKHEVYESEDENEDEDEETNLKRLIEQIEKRNHMQNVDKMFSHADMQLPGNIRLPGNKCTRAKLLQFPINRLLLSAKIRNLNEKSCIGKGSFCGILALYLTLPDSEVSQVESIIKTRRDICEYGLPHSDLTSTLEARVSGIKICNLQENHKLIGHKDLRGYFHMPRQFDLFKEQIEDVMNDNSITIFYIADKKIAHLACIAKLEGVSYIVDPAFCKSGGMEELNKANFEKYVKSLDHTDSSYIHLIFQPDRSHVSKKRDRGSQPIINTPQINALAPVSPIRKQKDENPKKRRRTRGGKQDKHNYTRRHV